MSERQVSETCARTGELRAGHRLAGKRAGTEGSITHAGAIASCEGLPEAGFAVECTGLASGPIDAG